MADCEICGQDANPILILPLHKADGCLNTFACQSCAEKSGAYCLKHNKIHLGFTDGTTACRSCIEEEIALNGEAVVALLSTSANLNEEPWEPLHEWAATASVLTGNAARICIARAIITLAKRRCITPDDVIQEVVAQGTPDILLPTTLLS